MNAAEIAAADLPQTLQDIADLVGLPATLKLVERWGGVRVFVPRKASEEHPIAQAIGLPAAQKLCAYFDGSEFPVPMAAAAVRRIRDRKIRHDREQGDTVMVLARRNQLTERQVYSILAGGDSGDDRQGGLF